MKNIISCSAIATLAFLLTTTPSLHAQETLASPGEKNSQAKCAKRTIIREDPKRGSRPLGTCLRNQPIEAICLEFGPPMEVWVFMSTTDNRDGYVPSESVTAENWENVPEC